MLKLASPYDRWKEIELHHNKLHLYTCIGVLGWMYLFDPRIFDNSFRSFLYIPVVLLGLLASGFLAGLLWSWLVMWLGRITSGAVPPQVSPNDDANFMQEFVESWWQHEVVLSTFVVTFRIFITVAIFELLTPIAESLAGVS